MLCEGCPLDGRPHHTVCSPIGISGGVLLLGGFPDTYSLTNAFYGKRTKLVRQIVGRIVGKLPQRIKPHYFYDYVCQCNPEYNKETKRYDITTAVFSRCANHVLSFIDVQKPKVIVALGADAFHALGIKGSVPGRRGRVETYEDKNAREIPVVCTFDVNTVLKDHGLITVFANDIAKAFKIAVGANHSVVNTVLCPTDQTEILTKLKNLYDGISNAPCDQLALAFDTETTSLLPYVIEDRVFSMSFSWAPHKGLSFPYDYKTQPATPELKEAVEAVLNHPKVRLITTNGSFDMRWLWKRGIKCPDHYWDVMLAEHCLDETKQGSYGLKQMTRDRFPAYANYEEELQAILNEAWKKKDDAKKELFEQAKVKTSDNMREWWVALPTNTRMQYLGDWVSAGYVDLKDTPYLSEVRYVKRKGEMVIPKKYTQALTRLLNKVPESVLPENIHAVPDIPEELEKKTYEDADLGVVLHYGALDAVITRLIYDAQKEDMRNDKANDADLAIRKGVHMLPIEEPFLGITMPLSSELARMQLHGIRVDRDKIHEYQQLLKERSEQVIESMRMEAGVAFNPNSPQELTKILFTDLGLPVLKYTDKGSPAVDADTLKDLADANPDVKILDDLMLYRKLGKTATTYLKNWLELSAYDGCIHTEFLQTGTATHRLSSTNPW